MADEQPPALEDPSQEDGSSPRPFGIPDGFWSGETLLKVQKWWRPNGLIKPFDEKQIDCNCYTLLMGNQYFVTSTKGDSEPPTITSLEKGEVFHIPPGQFAFLITKEEVFIPPFAMAFISMRTPFKFKGLVNVSGFHVDPGYKGCLVFAAYNASPTSVPIKQGERLFKIWFASLNRTSGEKYVFHNDPVTEIDPNLIHGMTRGLLSLQQLNDNIRDLKEDIEKKHLAVDAKISTKLAEFEPIIRNFDLIARSLLTGLGIALIVGVITTVWRLTAPNEPPHPPIVITTTSPPAPPAPAPQQQPVPPVQVPSPQQQPTPQPQQP